MGRLGLGSTPTGSTPAPRRRKRVSELLVIIAGHFHALGLAGYALLTLAVTLAVPAFVPTAAMALAAGLALGFSAIPAVLVGATAGSALAAAISRHLLRSRVAAVLATRPTLGALVAAVESEGWRVILLLRFGSPVPGALLSYAVGLTRIGMWRFSSATFLGKALPLTLLGSIGATGRAALERSELPVLQLSLLVAGVVATTLAAGLVARRFRALARAMRETELRLSA
jgi:uncharacterized membrane protein YdjX (TVP38/TMEM64 family)